MERTGKFRALPSRCLMHPFHLAILDLYLFIINQLSNKLNVSQSSVSCSRKLVEPKEGLLESPIYSHDFRSMGDNMNLCLAAEEEGNLLGLSL